MGYLTRGRGVSIHRADCPNVLLLAEELAGADDAIAAGVRISSGSYGWDGAFGTHFWVDPKEQLVAVYMTPAASPNRTGRDRQSSTSAAMS